jgi:hypothetical protein
MLASPSAPAIPLDMVEDKCNWSQIKCGVDCPKLRRTGCHIWLTLENSWIFMALVGLGTGK